MQEHSIPEAITEVSHELIYTLNQFRIRLNRIRVVPGPYQFWSERLGRHIWQTLEDINLVFDYSEIFVILDPPMSRNFESVSPHRVCDVEKCSSMAPQGSERDDCDNSFPNLETEEDDLSGLACGSFDASNQLPSDILPSSVPSVSNPCSNNSIGVVVEALWWPHPCSTNTVFQVDKLSDFASKQLGSKEISDVLLKDWQYNF